MVSEYEAEDLTQEVFVRISRALDAFRGESQLSTWIYRIATNAALDRLRSPAFQQAARSASTDALDSDETEIEERDPRTGEEAPSLEQQAFRQERAACYRDFIQDLPPNYRAVVALSELEELAPTEIAEVLGLSLGVVKIRLHRGRARLLHELRCHCKAEDWL